MEEKTTKSCDEYASSPEIPVEPILAGLCHAGPAIWFVPYSYVVPVAVWLATSRRSPAIARNAREAVVFWTCSHLALTAMASLIGLKWAWPLLWPVFTLWAGFAAWSAWNGQARPYPVVLKQVVVLWEQHEPAARAWLASAYAALVRYLRGLNRASQAASTGKAPADAAEEGPCWIQNQETVVLPADVKSVLQTRIEVPSWLKFGLAGGILGAVLGGPLSYWFQPGMVRQFISFPLYVSKLMNAADTLVSVSQGSYDFGFGIAQSVAETVIYTMIVTGIAGVVIGVVLGARRDARRRQQRFVNYKNVFPPESKG